MDMSNSMAELVDPEIYDTISQRPATNAEFAEPVKPSEAQDDSQRHAATSGLPDIRKWARRRYLFEKRKAQHDTKRSG
jgi:hypothetical protein